MSNYNYDQQNANPQSQQISQKGKKKSRLWMGCCGGCAGAVLIFLIAVGVASYFILRTKPVMPPAALFQPDADGFAVIQIDPEDEGLVELLQSLVKNPPDGLKELPFFPERVEQVPQQLETWAPLNIISAIYHLETPEEPAASQLNLGQLNEEIPPQIKRYMELRAEKKRFHKGTLTSLHRGGFLMRWMVEIILAEIEEQDGTVEEYRGVDLGKSPDGFFLSAQDNNVMLTDNENLLRNWVDILKEKGKDQDFSYNGPPHLQNIYERLHLPAPFFFAISNTEGQIESLFQSAKEMEIINQPNKHLLGVSEKINAVGGTFLIENADRVRVDIYAECKAEGYARGVSEGLVEWLQEQELEDIKIEGRVDGTMAHIRITYHQFQELIRR